MSTQQPRQPSPGAPRPGMRPPPNPKGAGGGSGAGASFDPLKLLQKYKFVLAGAMVLGVFAGIAAHYAFLYLSPGYKSSVLFVCSPAGSEVQIIGMDTIDEDEMARFMGTQVASMKGERVIDAVLQDARLQGEVPGWYSSYSKNGLLDVVDAYQNLEKIVKAHAIPNTYLIQLFYTSW